MSTDPIEERYGRSPARRRRTRMLGDRRGAPRCSWWSSPGWSGSGCFGPSASLGTRDLGYSLIGDDAIEVRYEVTADAGTSVSCALQALNSTFAIVGWKVVAIPPSEQGTRQFRETLRTSEPAVTGLIYRCWLT